MSKMGEAAAGLRPYPQDPGFKRWGTSREAAQRVSGGAESVREQIYAVLAAVEPQGLTADEAAAKVGRKPGYVRPRISELVQAGRVASSGARRRNESGLSATVWRIVP
jgi:hypothetical protein